MGKFNQRGSSRGGSQGNFQRKRGREPSGVCEFSHPTKTQLVFKATTSDVPMFNQPVVNKINQGQEIGKMDEIFGPSTSYYFSITPHQGIKLESFKKGDKIYIDKAFVLPLEYIQNSENPKPKISKGLGGSRGGAGGNRGGFRGGFRGGNRGSFRGGDRGNFRGGNRGFGGRSNNSRGRK